MRYATEEERRKEERSKRGRFIRPSALLGWQATPGGLELIYGDYSRELLPMSEQEAADNAFFLAREYGQDLVCIVGE